MNRKPKTSVAPAELRRRAEAQLRKRQRNQQSEVNKQRSAPDTQRLLHELQVHQIELEMQNEELIRAHAQAQASAEKFSDLYDFAPIGYVSLDDRGQIRELNFAAAKLLGKPRGKLAGTLLLESVAPSHRATFRQHLLAAAAAEANVTAEVDLAVADGRVVPIQLCTNYRRDTSSLTAQYLMALTNITERKQAVKIRERNVELEARVRERTAIIQQMAIELTLAEQREKIRLAQHLHDHLQQLLAGARYLLDVARQDASAQAQGTLRKLDAALSQSIDASRTLAVELCPPILAQEGLAAALTWLGRWMREKYGLSVRVTARPIPASLPEELEILMYHAARELLLNVVKHAQVKSARVDLAWEDMQAKLVISDQGKGFDPANLPTIASSASQFGLFALRERLRLLGGQVEIESAPGRGSRFTLRAPLEPTVKPSKRGKTKTTS